MDRRMEAMCGLIERVYMLNIQEKRLTYDSSSKTATFESILLTNSSPVPSWSRPGSLALLTHNSYWLPKIALTKYGPCLETFNHKSTQLVNFTVTMATYQSYSYNGNLAILQLLWQLSYQTCCYHSN